MSKNHRGTGIRSLEAHGRGTCAICKKENIKVLYETTIDEQTVKICKFCNANLKNKARLAKKAEASAAVETPTADAPAAEAETSAE